MEVFVKRFTIYSLLIVVFLIGPAIANQTIRLSDSESGATLLAQDEAGLRMRIDIGALELFDVTTPEGTFTRVVVGGSAGSNNVGEPTLPLFNRLISIPYGCQLSTELVDYEIQEISLSAYGITNPIMPAQPSLSKSQDPSEVPFEFDRALYRQSGYYKLPLAETEIMGFMRAMRLGLVSMAPIEYDPVNNMLRVYKNLTVRVNFINPDWNLTRNEWQRLYSPYFSAVYSRVINYPGQESMLLHDITRYPVKYVIVSHRMFEAQLQPFIEWKTKKGFTVVVGYTDVIGGTNAAIKAWIRNIYDNGTPEDPAPSFVLLVGDAQQIPPQAYSGHISDLNFCEYTSDNIPEIYYGRFSAQNTTQLQPQIDKTLEYEQYSMPDPNFLAEVTMIAGVDANYAQVWANGQINYGTSLYFNAAHGITSNTWLYPGSNGPVEAAIIQTINDGIGFINYTAHGSHDSWSDPTLTVGNVNSLTNAHKYPLAVGNCCLTGTFGTDYSTPCLGEVFLQAANKGAVGYIGGSNSTYWDEDYYWGVGYQSIVEHPTYVPDRIGAYDGMFHDHNEPDSLHYITNDAVVFCGNMAVQESPSSRKAYYWQVYHLFGDPSVMTYLSVPDPNTVVHDPAILFNSPQVTVQAVPGSYIGISQDGVLHGVGQVGSSGVADVDLTPFDGPGVADIVVTAQNRIPYISTIQLIAPSGPYVVYDSSHVNDSSGNNNGQIDCGEHIVLGVQLMNVGPDPASNVMARLSTSDTLVTITDSQEAYGTIPGNNGVSYSAGAFAFDVSGLSPDGASINFTLTIIFDGPDTVQGVFILPVHAPVMEYVSLLIDDIGNDNGIIDPGESANLTLSVTNAGSVQAVSVQGVLSETDDYISVIDADGSFGTIVPGDTADNSTNLFTVSAASYCPMGYSAVLTVAFTATGGYQGQITFPIMVGDRAVIYNDDFSSNLGWTGLGGAGEWAIGPAVGGTGDPAQDNSPSSDNRVMGNDLTSSGTYSNNLTQTYRIISPTIDCSNYTGVMMTYYHWLGVESNSYDHAYLEAYNGTAWIQLFANGSTTINESAWTIDQYDLSAIADGNANFKLRFGLGTTDGSVVYGGWNIDDILIRGYVQGSPGNPELEFSISSIADSLVRGDSVTHRFKIYNRGDANLGVGFTCDDGWLHFLPGEQTIPPLDSINYDVTLISAGLTPGVHNCTLDYTSNDTDHPSGSLPVELFVSPPECSYMPGDLNGNGIANGIDVTFGVTFFKGGDAPPDTCRNCPEAGQNLLGAGDVNGNCQFNGIDLTYYVAYFKGLQPGLHWCENCPPEFLAVPGMQKPSLHIRNNIQSGSTE